MNAHGKLLGLGVIFTFCYLGTARADNEEASSYLHFASRNDHVELDKSRGAIDLQKPFTIELWVRWDADIIDKKQYLAADEAWKGMSEKIPVTAECGWVIRTTPVKDADKQAIEFVIGASKAGTRSWLTLTTGTQRVEANAWQHVAICRTATDLRIFWNGKPTVRRSVAGLELHSAPSNIFLGVRKDAWEDRQFVGDIRACRLSSKSRYDEKFAPQIPKDKDEWTIAILDLATAEDGRVSDLSGNKHHGTVVGAKLIAPKK